MLGFLFGVLAPARIWAWIGTLAFERTREPDVDPPSDPLILVRASAAVAFAACWCLISLLALCFLLSSPEHDWTWRTPLGFVMLSSFVCLFVDDVQARVVARLARWIAHVAGHGWRTRLST